MNRQKIMLAAMVLGLIGITAAGLQQVRSGQRLGAPGVVTRDLPGANKLELFLPEAPGFKSQWVEASAAVTNKLPADTSFGQRVYQAVDGFTAQMTVVLMGTDRSSIHKPQICLPAQGWQIQQTEVTKVMVPRPTRYALPVIKIMAASQIPVNGQMVAARGIYVYWFVADGELSADASGFRRLGRSLWHLVRTGELQRWAYVSLFAVCEPGGEAATYARMERLIAATVPDFQRAGPEAAGR